MKPSIQQLEELNPIRLNDWNIRFIKFPEGVDPGDLTADDFNIRARGTGLPEMNISPIEINIRGLKVKVPGDGSVGGDLTVTVTESVDQKVINFLQRWREAAFNLETGERHNPKELKGQVILELLSPDLQTIRLFRLYGVWLTSYTLGELAGEPDAGIIEPSITLSYDYYEEQATG